MATAQLTKTPPRLRPANWPSESGDVILRTALLYILPAAIIMLLITFWPLIYQLWMSFTEYSNRNLRTTNVLLQMWGTMTGNLDGV